MIFFKNKNKSERFCNCLYLWNWWNNDEKITYLLFEGHENFLPSCYIKKAFSFFISITVLYSLLLNPCYYILVRICRKSMYKFILFQQNAQQDIMIFLCYWQKAHFHLLYLYSKEGWKSQSSIFVQFQLCLSRSIVIFLSFFNSTPCFELERLKYLEKETSEWR